MPSVRCAPAIPASTSPEPADIRKGRAAGFDAYLTKPLDLPALATALNSALRSAPAAASATSAA